MNLLCLSKPLQAQRYNFFLIYANFLHILVANCEKLVAFFSFKICVCAKKVVILQRFLDKGV